MRRFGLAWLVGSLLGLFACNDGNTNGSCAAGYSLGASGVCEPTTACPIGQSLCGGVCAATCGTQTGCAAGQVLCSGVCYAGTACPVTGVGGQGSGVGGQVSATTPVTPSSGGAPMGAGGTTQVVTKPSAGGATVTTTAYVDPDPTSCTDTSTTTNTLTAQYQRLNLSVPSVPGKTYAAMTNWWGVYSNQSISVAGLSFSVTSQNASASGGDPVGYPSIFIGQYQQTTTGASNLPKLVSSISSVPIVFDTNLTSISNNDLNASLDVWFNTSSSPLPTTANAPTGGYLMVWLGKPANYQPRGGIVMNGVTISGASGSWDVWSDGKCVSYVRTSAISALTFDLNQFIKHAVSNNKVISGNWYLGAIFGGFEIWKGGSGAKVNKFCAKVN